MSQRTATLAHRRSAGHPVHEAHPVDEGNPVASARTRRFERLGS
jgi:hypothetical protein